MSKVASKIQAVRGMNDHLPAQQAVWDQVIHTIVQTAKRYGYSGIETPIVEQTDLFCRAIGQDTDVVGKEMYGFVDRNEDHLSLRPEGTAGVVRACIEHNLNYNQGARLYYYGPMFRRERPQKGRLRAFHQVGIEAFGIGEPFIDVELIQLQQDLWQSFLLTEHVNLEVNYLASAETRRAYRGALQDYFAPYDDLLTADQRVRLANNPLRILDSKDPKLKPLIQQAPKLADYYTPDETQIFARILNQLQTLDIGYQINPYLVRGLDYYNGFTYEWTTPHLGAQATISAGGRYDLLTSQLGGPDTPATGFALGLERLILLIEHMGQWQCQPQTLLYAIGLDDASQAALLQLLPLLRASCPEIQFFHDLQTAKLKTHLRRADRADADAALILGSGELEKGECLYKPLRSPNGRQVAHSLAELGKFLSNHYPTGKKL